MVPASVVAARLPVGWPSGVSSTDEPDVGGVADGAGDGVAEKGQRHAFPAEVGADLAVGHLPPDTPLETVVEVDPARLEAAVGEIDGRGGIAEVETGDDHIGQTRGPRTPGKTEFAAQTAGKRKGAVGHPFEADPLGEGRHREAVAPEIEGELFVAGRRVPGQRAFEFAGTVTEAEARRTRGSAVGRR